MGQRGRFYLLDIVRGCAALSVVVWHYQHFFYSAPAMLRLSFDRALQPFYALLWPLYDESGHAVQVFSRLAPDFDRASQPFYALLWPFYEQGGRAVQMFFVLSGFVFFYHYRDAIRTQAIDARRFFLLRFSRLYPLHAATLLLVAAGQFLSRALDGEFVAYPCNSIAHFGLNLFFGAA